MLATDSAVDYGVFSIPLYDGVSGRAGPRLRSAAGPLSEFIAGPENAALNVAVQAILERNRRFHPICFYGSSGLGKTHLVRGLVHRLNGAASRNREPAEPIAKSMPGADFARAITDAMQTDSLDELRQSFASLQVFALDNLDELKTKPHAQQELCTLTDIFAARGAMLIVTSRGAPAESSEYSPALLSRLAAGLILPIERPSEPTCRAYLARLVGHIGESLTEFEIEQLAKLCVNQPTGRIDTILARYGNFVLAADIDDPERRLAQFLEEDDQADPDPTMKQIAAQTARLFQVTQRDLCGPTRRQAVVKARGVAMFVARKLIGESLGSIGRYFGRDHTTVMHACKRTESLIEQDAFVAETVDRLLKHWSF